MSSPKTACLHPRRRRVSRIRRLTQFVALPGALFLVTACEKRDNPQVREANLQTGELEMRDGHYDTARITFTAAAEATNKKTNPVAWAETQTALARCDAGELKDAAVVARLKDVVPIYETQFGAEDARLATPLDLLGESQHLLGRLAEAEPLLKRALAIDEKFPLAGDASTVRDLKHLASLYRDLQRPADALPLLQRALAIDEKTLGRDHPVVALDLSNIAQVLRALNRTTEAIPLLERAVAVYGQASIFQAHSQAATLFSLAEFYRSGGTPEKAAPLEQKAMEFSRAATVDSTDPAAVLDEHAVIGRTLQHADDFKTAFRRAVDIAEKCWGPENPHVATYLNDLGDFLKDAGDHQAAEPVLRRALLIKARAQQRTGGEFRDFELIRKNYAGVLKLMNVLPTAAEQRLDSLLHGTDPGPVAAK